MKKEVLDVTLIFLVAFSIRIGAIAFTEHYVNSDGSGRYVPTAHKIFEGNVESLRTISPLYPVFLASIYLIYGEAQKPFVSKPDPVQNLVMIFQAFLGALACIFYFITYRTIVKKKIALVSTLLAAIYLPLAVEPTINISSEILSVFLMSITGMVLTKITSEADRTAATRVLMALLLTIVVFVLILNHRMFLVLFVPLPLILIFMPNGMKLKYRFAHSFCPFVALSLILFLSWFKFAYDEKSGNQGNFGLNLIQSIMQTNQIWARYGIIDKPQYVISDKRSSLFFTENQLELLDLKVSDSLYSFRQISDKQKTDDALLMRWAIKLLRDNPIPFLLASARRIWFVWVGDLLVTQHAPESLAVDMRPSEDFRANKQWVLFAISSFGYIIGLLGMVGQALFYNRILHLVSVIIALTGFLCIVHPHTYYAISVHAYILMVACITSYYLYMRYWHKLSKLDAENHIFE